MKLKKWIPRLLVMLTALAVLASVLYFAVQNYAKHKVIAAIEEIVDGPVEVDQVRLGREQVVIRGLRVYQSDQHKSAWLMIDRAELGLGFRDVIRGESMPETATIHGAEIVLQYDEDGKLLTSLSPWQDGVEMRLREIDVRRANVEIRQRGKTPLIAKQIDGKIRRTKDIHIKATVGGALNARWNLEAHIRGDSFATNAELATNRLKFSTDQLAKLPFFPEEITRDVRASGISPIQLALQIDKSGEPKYRVEFTPSSLDVDIRDAGLAFTGAEGRVVVQNDFVEFTGLRGDVSGGRFSVDGQMRRRNGFWKGAVRGNLDTVPLAELPKNWQLPEQVRGIASAQGRLEFELADSYFQLSGDANATIAQAQFAGISARPVKVELDLQQLRKSKDVDELTLDGNATVDVDIPEVELAALLKAAKIDATDFEDLAGSIGFQAALDVPLATITDPKTYQAAGTVASSDLQFREMRLDGTEADFEFTGGIATIHNLDTKIAKTGKLQGSFEIEVEPPGSVTANLGFESLPASLIENLFDGSNLSLSGLASGNVRARAPLRDWKKPQAWQAEGQVTSGDLAVAKQRLTDVDAKFGIQQGRVAVMDGSARWKGATLEASGDVRVRQPHAYNLTVSTSNLDVETAAEFAAVKLPVNLTGQAKVNATVTGQLEPLSWNASGEVRLDNLIIKKLKVDSPSAKWQADKKRLKVTEGKAEIFGGNVQFEAEIPLDEQVPTSISGTFSGVDPELAMQHLPAIPLDLAGKASGEFSLTGIENLETASGTMKVGDLKAEAYDVQFDDLVVDVSLQRQKVDLKATAEALGGAVALSTSGLLKDMTHENRVRSVNVTAKGVMLGKVWNLIGQDVQVAPPEGLANVDLDLQLAGPSLKPTGSGRVVVHNLRWKNRNVVPRLTTGVTLLGDSLVLPDFSFDYAGGRITSRVVFRLDELGSGSYSLVARNVSLRNTLFAFPQLAREARGTVDAAFRGRFANLRLEGSGKLQVSGGELAGVPIRSHQTGVTFAFDVPSRSGEADIRLTRAEIARGRSTGTMSIKWGRRFTLDGKASFTNLELRPLVRAMPMLTDQLDGRVSGTVAFHGRNIRSWDDISGTFDLQIANSQLLHLPVLSDLTYATGIGSSSKTFSKTKIKGRKNRSMIHVDRMTMVAASVHMFIQGTITTRGQLDLEVVADTGELLAIGVATSLVRPLDWLRRRLIFLHVGGTVRSPVVLPQTEKFIQQEVLLFFLPFAGFQ